MNHEPTFLNKVPARLEEGKREEFGRSEVSPKERSFRRKERFGFDRGEIRIIGLPIPPSVPLLSK